MFGSAITGRFDPKRSDVDFIVIYPAAYDVGPGMSRFDELEAELAAVLGRPLDIVMATAPEMSNERFRREADKTRTVIYDASKVAEVA